MGVPRPPPFAASRILEKIEILQLSRADLRWKGDSNGRYAARDAHPAGLRGRSPLGPSAIALLGHMLWTALAWSGNIAFLCAIVVHYAVGYHAGLHLAPAFAGWIAWNAALLASHGWLTRQQRDTA